MKILWITNQPTPDIAEAANIKSGFGGGWMNLLSKQIAEKYELAMVFPVSAELEYKNGKNGSVRYYLIPTNKVKLKPDSKTVDYIKQTIRDFDPDIIHIWGTEYLHSYEAVTAAEQCGMLDKVVVSIQGLVSVYAEHFYCGLSEYDFRKPTAASLINCNGINKQKSNFVKRGKYERLVLKKVNNVIGRTDWDEACTKQINPSVKYHFCNETLRESFYEHRWDINKCQRYSIFVSQAQYPIKGFHKSLEALAVLKKKYPDVDILYNPYYETRNNISSMFVAREYLENSICVDGDQIIYNPDILSPYFECSGYAASELHGETDEWVMQTDENGIVTSASVGGDHGWQLFGISRWNSVDGRMLKHYVEEEYLINKNYDIWWDNIPLFIHPEDFKLKVYEIAKTDLKEIDNFYELIEVCGRDVRKAG